MKYPCVLGLLMMNLVLVPAGALAFDLVREGRACATIVLPETPSEIEQAAANTLVRYLKQATGVALPMVREGAAPPGALVSVGHTQMAATAGLSEEGLRYDGYRLQVKGRVLYLYGRDVSREPGLPAWVGARGTQRAALALLERLGFRWVLPTEQGVRIPSLAIAAVPDDLNVVHNPPFMYATGRMNRWGDWSLANGFRTAIKLFTRGGHTWVEYVPASLWETHPEYFRMQGGQRIQPVGDNYFLCPSNPAVIELLAEGIRKKFDEGYELVQLGQSDGYEPCECPSCRALDKPGEFHEQVHVPHYEVIRKVGQTHPNKQVHLLIYGPTAHPSAKVDRYPPNAVLEICSSDEEKIRYWSARAPGGCTVYVYYMGTYHETGLAPKFSPRRMAEEIRKLHRLGVKGIYFCGGGENWGAEGPTYYVAGRMMEDPTADWSRLLDEYCETAFGKAARTMRRYYDLLYSRVDSDARTLDGAQRIFPAMFPLPVLDRLDTLLAVARREAADDARALGWLRLVELSDKHFSLIAKAYHQYAAYEANRTLENLRRTGEAVAAYRAFADQLLSLGKTEPQFVSAFFPNYGAWNEVATNCNHLGSPFKWDFEALLRAKVLPGQDRAQGRVARLGTAPVLDGVLEEDAWQGVAWQNLQEVSLGSLEAKTRFRIGYDNQALYLAVECEEPLIEEMVVKNYVRDGPLFRTECVEVFLDPEGQGKKILHFIAAPTEGGRYDARKGYLTDPLHPLVLKGAEDTSWNPEWKHAFAIDKAGRRWTMEIALPFASLGVAPPVPGTRWRVNIGRERNKASWGERYPRVPIELSLWSPNLQKASFMDPSVFGEMVFE